MPSPETLERFIAAQFHTENASMRDNMKPPGRAACGRCSSVEELAYQRWEAQLAPGKG